MNTTQYKPWQYFSLTILITWILQFIAAYFSYREGMTGLAFLIMLPSMFMPFLIALLMVSGKDNQSLRKDFWRRLNPKYIHLSYLPAIFTIMPLTVLLATNISLLFGLPASQFLPAEDFQTISGKTILTLFILFMAPAFEELGWRGYGVDSLRSKYNLFQTTLIFAVLWAIWHLPLFFINGYYQHELWQTNLVYVINFFAQVMVAAVLLNWMYYKNQRSILAAILFHFMFNLPSVALQTEQTTKCIITGLLLILSICIVLKEKESFFAPSKPKTNLTEYVQA